MKSITEKCTACRECCKFEEDDVYFAPLFAEEEMKEVVKRFPVSFAPFKSSKTVFQIKLIKSKNDEKIFVCPLLDEETHLCKAYAQRPFDCRIWPFLFMKDKENKTVLACFDKDMCPRTDTMNKLEFNKYKEDVVEWIKTNNGFELIKENPFLVWNYEKDTSVISVVES